MRNFLELVRCCLEFDPQKRFTPDQALAHEWIIEGLPPQIQVQHLKFIKDTTQPDQKEVSRPTVKLTHSQSSKPSQPDQEANLFAQFNPESVRSQVSTEKSSLRINAVNEERTQEKSTERAEREEKDSPQSKQKRIFTRKLNGAQKEKINFKGIAKPLNQDMHSISTKNLYEMSSQRDVATPSSRKANFESLYKPTNAANTTADYARNPPKKAPADESYTKSNLVLWDSPTRKQGSIDEKGFKSNLDLSLAKKSTNYYNFSSPKVSSSVERVLGKSDKEFGLSASKVSLLPSLKHSASQKAK